MKLKIELSCKVNANDSVMMPIHSFKGRFSVFFLKLMVLNAPMENDIMSTTMAHQ